MLVRLQRSRVARASSYPDGLGSPVKSFYSGLVLDVTCPAGSVRQFGLRGYCLFLSVKGGYTRNFGRLWRRAILAHTALESVETTARANVMATGHKLPGWLPKWRWW